MLSIDCISKLSTYGIHNAINIWLRGYGKMPYPPKITRSVRASSAARRACQTS